MERHEGHLLNWYDTSTLSSLLPRYVSTVDSGNLAGALMTLAEGLRDFPQAFPEIFRATVAAVQEVHPTRSGGPRDDRVMA